MDDLSAPGPSQTNRIGDYSGQQQESNGQEVAKRSAKPQPPATPSKPIIALEQEMDEKHTFDELA